MFDKSLKYTMVGVIKKFKRFANKNVITVNKNLHYKCEVAKLGTAATGNFLLGKRKKA